MDSRATCYLCTLYCILEKRSRTRLLRSGLDAFIAVLRITRSRLETILEKLFWALNPIFFFFICSEEYVTFIKIFFFFHANWCGVCSDVYTYLHAFYYDFPPDIVLYRGPKIRSSEYFWVSYRNVLKFLRFNRLICGLCTQFYLWETYLSARETRIFGLRKNI